MFGWKEIVSRKKVNLVLFKNNIYLDILVISFNGV